jgi:hypothetical protein
MKKIALIAAVALLLIATSCTPSTVTATPSTLKPACRELTTLTGTVSPADQIRNIVIEFQGLDGKWKVWNWFYDFDQARKEIRKSVAADGTWKLTYVPPVVTTAGPTLRLRARGTKLLGAEGGTISKSWYVTVPIGCS